AHDNIDSFDHRDANRIHVIGFFNLRENRHWSMIYPLFLCFFRCIFCHLSPLFMRMATAACQEAGSARISGTAASDITAFQAVENN
ncbi:MAG: hypothetical protein ACYCZL_10845, partial [Polaromonas sp.]